MNESNLFLQPVRKAFRRQQNSDGFQKRYPRQPGRQDQHALVRKRIKYVSVSGTKYTFRSVASSLIHTLIKPHRRQDRQVKCRLSKINARSRLCLSNKKSRPCVRWSESFECKFCQENFSLAYLKETNKTFICEETNFHNHLEWSSVREKSSKLFWNLILFILTFTMHGIIKCSQSFKRRVLNIQVFISGVI